MVTFRQRFFRYFVSSAVLLLYSAIVLGGQGDISFLLPGLVVTVACSLVGSLLCAVTLRTEKWWATLVAQAVSLTAMLLAYWLIS